MIDILTNWQTCDRHCDAEISAMLNEELTSHPDKRKVRRIAKRFFEITHRHGGGATDKEPQLSVMEHIDKLVGDEEMVTEIFHEEIEKLWQN
jgi:3-methyladenine DNA glycosylase AlkD